MISINVRGIANDKKRRAVFDFHRKNADILIVQETHSNPKIESVWESEWGGRALYAHGETNARGIVAFVSKDIFARIDNITRDIEGRYLIFDLKEENVKITIVALYAPNIDSPGFFKEIVKILREKSENKILVGDYNLTLDIEKDRLNTYHNNNTARDEVLGIMEEFYLADTWRNRNEQAREFSWFKKLSRGEDRKASRIDYALISSGLDQHVHMIDYISSIMTDHRAIYLVVDFSESERGTGYWKLNTLLLTKKEYVEKINLWKLTKH